MGNSPYVLRSVMNPNGGAIIRVGRKERSSSINVQCPPSIQRAASDILADYAPLVFGNRSVRTRFVFYCFHHLVNIAKTSLAFWIFYLTITATNAFFFFDLF